MYRSVFARLITRFDSLVVQIYSKENKVIKNMSYFSYGIIVVWLVIYCTKKKKYFNLKIKPYG